MITQAEMVQSDLSAQWGKIIIINDYKYYFCDKKTFAKTLKTLTVISVLGNENNAKTNISFIFWNLLETLRIKVFCL